MRTNGKLLAANRIGPVVHSSPMLVRRSWTLAPGRELALLADARPATGTRPRTIAEPSTRPLGIP